jgi:heterodisulfide reductase subunit A-like polyferredoxin
MAIARAAKLEPLKVASVPVNNTALILGGGAAGMNATLALADQGFPVHLVERQEGLGGNLRHLRYFLPGSNGGQAWSPREYLSEIVSRVEAHPLVTVHLDSELVETHGFKGNFTTTLHTDGQSFQVQHGVIIVATGGEEYKGDEYGYGQNPRVLTQLELEELLGDRVTDDPTGQNGIPNSVTMILCVGPAEKYCSRLCCTTAIKNALKLKELNPRAEVTILYRDIRTYGFKEKLYTQARRAGVRFIQYEFDRKPQVEFVQDSGDASTDKHAPSSSGISVRVWEPVLDRELVLKPDLLVLSNPVVPPQGTRELASRLKLSVDMDGFFLEAHVKLRPVDFAAEGIFMAGAAHYPKFLDESIVQALAAASRAAGILSQETMLTNARVAVVDPLKCVGCLTCVRICPYDVPLVSGETAGVGAIMGAAYIEPAICHGCGSCASECPAQAIQVMHYTDAQILTKVDSLFGSQARGSGFIPLESVQIQVEE